MFVNKIKIVSDLNKTDLFFNIPVVLNQDISLSDQTDILNTQLVETAKEESTNPIIDYDKVRFSPVIVQNSSIFSNLTNINYKLLFLDEDNEYTFDKWSDIGFVEDDFIYRRNRVKKSFLRLSFYDSDNPLSQNLLFVMTLFPDLTASGVTVNSKIEFSRENPLIRPKGLSEGYHLYFYKDLVENGYDLYVKGEFLNANTGKTIKLKMNENITPIDNYNADLYLKYTLKFLNNNYVYIIDSDNSNIDFQGNSIKITLFESTVI